MNIPATLSRRRLLHLGGLGTLNLAIPGTVAARVDGGPMRRDGAAEKSCIFILLCGGPSHLDTWDLKPAAPLEIRGPYEPIATAVPGMRICELHPRLAKLTQHFCLIRSMTHPWNISTLVVVTGEFGRTPRINQNQGIPGRQRWPHCYSAILAGAGIRGGMVYGESDKIGAYVKDKPVRPQDFSATIYHALGVHLATLPFLMCAFRMKSALPNSRTG